MFKNKSILITGGTGSFGKQFIQYLLRQHKKLKRIIVYSRDELKQYEMEKNFPESKFKNLRYFIGDVRDKDRLNHACHGVDIIVHAAALKHVPIAEYNPIETIKTNILGAQNIIDAAINNNVEKVVALSTDKATAPLNLYGASKLCAEKLFSSANMYRGSRNVKFGIVRYGNVLNSRGSVIPNFLNQLIKSNKIFITDKRMTRFTMTLDESVELVIYALKNLVGGETVIPKIPSYKILDLANAVKKNSKIVFTGLRPGEKYHEELVTSSESYRAVHNQKKIILIPDFIKKNIIKKRYTAKEYPSGKAYSSDKNKFINSVELRKILIYKKIVNEKN